MHKARQTGIEETLLEYAEKRKWYRFIVKEAKSKFYQEEEKKILELAEEKPFTILKQRTPKFPKNIDIHRWVTHFSPVLQYKDTRIQIPTSDQGMPLEIVPFTTEEVELAIRQSKDKRACGPDEISNEHIKIAWPFL